jgi:single stranded DNA-binding protein
MILGARLLLTRNMEQAMNRIILIGTTGRDPEARGAQNNIINCSLAVDSYSKGEKGVDWFNLVLFGATGESFMKAVTKGKHIAIEGKIKTRTWEKMGARCKTLMWWLTIGALSVQRYLTTAHQSAGHPLGVVETAHGLERSAPQGDLGHHR